MDSKFGVMPDGTAVELIRLAGGGGLEVDVIPYGCIIVSLRTPDRTGRLADVVLGFDSLDPYLHSSPYFGAVVGRYANRIANGRFSLDGRTYQLTVNEPPNHLHGGAVGFDKRMWDSARSGRNAVTLRRTSGDGEEGYPGNLTVEVTYTLTDRNELLVDYAAECDKPTPINLTQHSYFNLRGEGDGDILGHQLRINANSYLPVTERLIPPGWFAPVEKTPFDFRHEIEIGGRIDSADEQLRYGHGYDHTFVLNPAETGLAHAARLFDPSTGRAMDVLTTEPGLQFYSGNVLDGSLLGKSGRRYGRRAGLCLETQHFPDSPNRPEFPSTILRPGGRFTSRTVLAFSADA
jgi:aldose 1-epimerase